MCRSGEPVRTSFSRLLTRGGEEEIGQPRVELLASPHRPDHLILGW
jgi:hypothetical protein